MTIPAILSANPFAAYQPVEDFGFARRVIEGFAAYDEMRLSVYAARAGNPGRIAIRRFGSAVAMRFPAVNYFNQVYHLDEDALDYLDEIEEFYRREGVSPKLFVAPDTDREAVFGRLFDAGYSPVEKLVRLASSRLAAPPARRAPDLEVERVRADRVDEFFNTYLDAFGADPAPARRAAALANMRLLHAREELHLFLTRREGRPVGIGVLHHQGDTGCLCGGATLPEYRRSGSQTLLIAERMRQAAGLRCKVLTCWTESGGQSHANLGRAGFREVYHDSVWMRRPVD